VQKDELRLPLNDNVFGT